MSLMPNYLLREWTNDGKLASGGFLYFYSSLTLTPKTVYADAGLTTPLTNPVQLDASGSAVIFLGAGPYRIWLKDKFGAQIAPWVDGIVGGDNGSGVGSNSTFSTVKIYQDLRNLSIPTDFVYVSGRLVAGDGGAGIFQRLQTTTTDDDGIILTQNSGTIAYKRVFDAGIDPLWYGVKYNTAIDNKLLWDRTVTASLTYNFPVIVAGPIYINQNFNIPSDADIWFNDGGYFYAGTSITVIFQSGSQMNSVGKCFGDNITPIFQTNTVESIKLSWMGGTIADDRWNKLIASTSGANSASLLSVDESISISNGTINISAPIAFCNNSIVTITDTSLNLSAPFIKLNQTQMFNISSVSNINAVDLGNQFVMPEVFGATGNIINDQWKAILAAFRTGKVILSKSRIYSILTAIPTLGNLEIIGGGALYLATNISLTTTNFTIRDTGIGLQTPGNWITTQIFNGYQSFFPSTITVTNSKVIDGCIYSDKPDQFPVYDGKPNIYNAYLPLIKYAPNLRTDSVGKIYSDYNFTNGLSNWNIECSNYGSISEYSFPSISQDNTNIFAPSYFSTDNRIRIKNKFDDSPMLYTTYTVPSQVNQGFGYFCKGIVYMTAISKYIGFWQTKGSTSTYKNIILTSSNLLNGTWTQIWDDSYTTNDLTTFQAINQADDGFIWTSLNNTNTFMSVDLTGAVTIKSYTNNPNINIVGVLNTDHTKIVALASTSQTTNYTVAVSNDSGTTWTTYSAGIPVNYHDACFINDSNNVMVCGADNGVCSLYRFTSFPAAPIAIEYDTYGVSLVSSNMIIKALEYHNGSIVTQGTTNAIYVSINGGYNFTRKYQGTLSTATFDSRTCPGIYVAETSKVFVAGPYTQILSSS